MYAKKVAIFVSTCLLLLVFGSALAKATVIKSNEIVPLNRTVFVPCAAGGIGEDVLLEGNLHVLLHLTDDSNGGFHGKMKNQPQGVRGYGALTGDMYQGNGVTQQTISIGSGSLPFTTTFVSNFLIIGQGSGNNYLAHTRYHLTVNANGDVAVEIDEVMVDCK